MKQEVLRGRKGRQMMGQNPKGKWKTIRKMMSETERMKAVLGLLCGPLGSKRIDNRTLADLWLPHPTQTLHLLHTSQFSPGGYSHLVEKNVETL